MMTMIFIELAVDKFDKLHGSFHFNTKYRHQWILQRFVVKCCRVQCAAEYSAAEYSAAQYFTVSSNIIVNETKW